MINIQKKIMGNFFMGKDQTVGRSMKIWQMPRLFSYFFAPFPYFCLFIFRCTMYGLRYEKGYERGPITTTGKCVREDMFCKHKSLELKTAWAAAWNAWDEYKEWKTDVLRQKAPESGNILEIMEKHGDDLDKWKKAEKKKKLKLFKDNFKIMLNHAHSLSKTVKECKSKN